MLTHHLYPVLLIVFFGLSAVTFFLFMFDKLAAMAGKQRIPERTLLVLCACGGWPGGLLAQVVFRHKRRKQSFQRRLVLAIVANCCAVILVIHSSG